MFILAYGNGLWPEILLESRGKVSRHFTDFLNIKKIVGKISLISGQNVFSFAMEWIPFPSFFFPFVYTQEVMGEMLNTKSLLLY